jgi:ribosomal protein L37AE/L43A
VGVLLSGEEEHVCPYCLEEVVKNDRRGVKVCKVCKTWHHGDCWAITGVCQVPHQYVN